MPPFAFPSLVYLSVCISPAVWWLCLSAGSWACCCLLRLEPYQRLISTALTHLQFSDLCRLAHKRDWVPPGVVYCPALLGSPPSVSSPGNDLPQFGTGPGPLVYLSGYQRSGTPGAALCPLACISRHPAGCSLRPGPGGRGPSLSW